MSLSFFGRLAILYSLRVSSRYCFFSTNLRLPPSLRFLWHTCYNCRGKGHGKMAKAKRGNSDLKSVNPLNNPRHSYQKVLQKGLWAFTERKLLCWNQPCWSKMETCQRTNTVATLKRIRYTMYMIQTLLKNINISTVYGILFNGLEFSTNDKNK